MVEEALADGGFESAITASGEEAITLLRDDTQYRAVVTDINLIGKLDGWEVARAAREDRSDDARCLYDRNPRRRNGGLYGCPE